MNSLNQKMEELIDARIISKNLVYIIGLSSALIDKDKLNKYEYLGQYGSIEKIIVNENIIHNKNSPHGPTYSVFVTFSKPSEASIAILSLDDNIIDNHLIRATFGTTKYCINFLKGIECINKDCLFLHKWAEESYVLKRGDLISFIDIFKNQKNYARKLADIYNPEVKKRILSSKKVKTIFPSPDIIYKSNPFMNLECNNSEISEDSKIENEKKDKKE